MVESGCSLANGGCQHNCHVNNDDGSIRCSCRPGFQLDENNGRSCYGMQHLCNIICLLAWAANSCYCAWLMKHITEIGLSHKPAFKPAFNGRKEDANIDCIRGENQCHQICLDKTSGQFSCLCDTGFRLSKSSMEACIGIGLIYI
jgi:hypothetical protein